MKKTLKKHINAFRFKRYCRGAYAVFNSLHREVTIGRVATYIADKQLRKAVAACAVAMMLLPSNEAVAQNEDAEDMITLPEVVVSVSTDTLSTPQPAAVLTKKDFNNTSVRSVGDLLALIPGLDIRSRGINDVQGDISVHGGTFDQMVVLLNGINLTDAQTGHHNLDMPIDIAMVERVELLSPSMLLAKGIVSYCGAVNIVVSDAYCKRLLAEISGGSYGTGKLSFLVSDPLGKWITTMAASYNRSDGYMRNTDYRHGSLFVQASRHSQNDHWLLQLGGQVKNFGSLAFYSTSYPYQYEATRTLTASASNMHRFGNSLRLESDIYTRIHADRFELFRDGYVEAPEWYSGHNHHLSATSGLRNRIVYKFGCNELMAGTELRHEGIVSNVLGNALGTDISLFNYDYPKASSRVATSLFTGYGFAKNGWQASANALVVYSNFFGWNYGLSANAGYRLGKHTRLRMAASRTFRQPTFTDLYYQSVNQVANPDLNSEKAWSGEMELCYSNKFVNASAMAYFRSGRDVIDWIRKPDEEVWHSMNHTAVDALGADLSARFNISKAIPALGFSYSLCNISQDAGEFISGSVLDYLRHKAQAYVVFAPWAPLKLKLDAIYRYREGKYVDENGKICEYGGVFLFNAKIEYTLKKATFFAEAHNLADQRYRDHGGVPQPGIMLYAGIKVKINDK